MYVQYGVKYKLSVAQKDLVEQWHHEIHLNPLIKNFKC